MCKRIFSLGVALIAAAVMSMPDVTLARGGGGGGGGGHGGGGGGGGHGGGGGGGGGHFGGGGGGGHFGGGGGGFSGSHASGGFGGARSMGAMSGGSFRGGSTGGARMGGMASSGAFRGGLGAGGFHGNAGAASALRSGSAGGMQSSIASRSGGLGASRSGGTFLASHSSMGGNFAGRGAGAGVGTGSGRSFSAMNGGGFGGRGFGWGGRGFGYGGLGYGGLGYGGLGFGYGFGGGLLSSLLFGLGGYGYGGYGGYGGGYGGYGGYGGGYGGYGGYGNSGYCSTCGVNSYGAGYDPYSGFGGSSMNPNAYAALTQPAAGLSTGVLGVPAQSVTTAATPVATGSSAFTEKGEAAFKAGDYNGAISAWKHAVIDDPQNPVLMMMLGQALFATGRFEEAAGATQMAMHAIPKGKWGVVAGNYKDLYGNAQDYTTQLRALEQAVGAKPNDPAQRFLLGFHYAYLGFPQQAVDQLDKGLKIAPQDEMAKLLRNELQAKLPSPTTPAASGPTLLGPSA